MAETNSNLKEVVLAGFSGAKRREYLYCEFSQRRIIIDMILISFYNPLYPWAEGHNEGEITFATSMLGVF